MPNAVVWNLASLNTKQSIVAYSQTTNVSFITVIFLRN